MLEKLYAYARFNHVLFGKGFAAWGLSTTHSSEITETDFDHITELRLGTSRPTPLSNWICTESPSSELYEAFSPSNTSSISSLSYAVRKSVASATTKGISRGAHLLPFSSRSHSIGLVLTEKLRIGKITCMLELPKSQVVISTFIPSNDLLSPTCGVMLASQFLTLSEIAVAKA